MSQPRFADEFSSAPSLWRCPSREAMAGHPCPIFPARLQTNGRTFDWQRPSDQCREALAEHSRYSERYRHFGLHSGGMSVVEIHSWHGRHAVRPKTDTVLTSAPRNLEDRGKFSSQLE